MLKKLRRFTVWAGIYIAAVTSFWIITDRKVDLSEASEATLAWIWLQGVVFMFLFFAHSALTDKAEVRMWLERYPTSSLRVRRLLVETAGIGLLIVLWLKLWT